MKKVYLKNQLKGYPIEVISNVLDVINVLGENYGAKIGRASCRERV